jgi:hypothetical protein
MLCTGGISLAQVSGNSGPPPRAPRDIVEEVWNMGVSGALLTPGGWNRAAGYFSQPGPAPKDNSFDVYSNRSGFYSVSVEDDRAEVEMDFWNSGHIDSEMRYTPPPKTIAFKTVVVFSLKLHPTSIKMYGADGKTEIEEKPTGLSHWEIEGPLTRRWTTVNTAIRYVLETRDKTTNLVVKKNADGTLAKLLTLH